MFRFLSTGKLNDYIWPYIYINSTFILIKDGWFLFNCTKIYCIVYRFQEHNDLQTERVLTKYTILNQREVDYLSL